MLPVDDASDICFHPTLPRKQYDWNQECVYKRQGVIVQLLYNCSSCQEHFHYNSFTWRGLFSAWNCRVTSCRQRARKISAPNWKQVCKLYGRLLRLFYGRRTDPVKSFQSNPGFDTTQGRLEIAERFSDSWQSWRARVVTGNSRILGSMLVVATRSCGWRLVSLANQRQAHTKYPNHRSQKLPFQQQHYHRQHQHSTMTIDLYPELVRREDLSPDEGFGHDIDVDCEVCVVK